MVDTGSGWCILDPTNQGDVQMHPVNEIIRKQMANGLKPGQILVIVGNSK